MVFRQQHLSSAQEILCRRQEKTVLADVERKRWLQTSKILNQCFPAFLPRNPHQRKCLQAENS